MLVFNLAEVDDKNAVEVFSEFVRDKLKVESQVAVQRAHRLGRPRRDGKPRPLIALLRDYPDVECLFRNAKNLKGSRYGLSRDFPEEIRKARARLEADRRKARRENKAALIAYPAKLVVNGRVDRDEFPDWSTVLNGTADDLDDEDGEE